MSVIMNLAFLPWGDGRYGRSIFEAARAAKDHFDEELSPLFVQLFELLAFDKGADGSEAGDTGARRLFRDVFDSVRLRQKSAKVGMCRFYQLVVEMKRFLPDWHSF